MIKTLNTGNKTLDKEIPLLTTQELDELARYASYLRWSRVQANNTAWTDAPLAIDEENIVIKKPVSIGVLSDEQMNAELEKGYTDMLAGRTAPADEVFAAIRRDYGKLHEHLALS